MYVEVRLSFIDPMILALVVYLVGVILSVVSVKWERRLGMDIFSSVSVGAGAGVQKEPAIETTPKEESAFDKMSREAREEQMERILKLLNKDDENKNK
jgi:hypothetical protein